jgi:type IV secretion system protein VirD4
MHPLRYAGDGHLITVAPTRTGKGIGVIIPNLLTYPGSMIVTDPKGENYAVTARHRRTLGHAVHAFDPFDVTRSFGKHRSDVSAAFNPLDLINPNAPDAMDDARMLADMLVVSDDARHASGESAFWNEEARSVLMGLILHVAANRPTPLRHLPHVRELLTLPPDEFEALLQEMSRSDAVGGLVARSAARILQKAEKERSGVISAAQSHTHFLDSPRMAGVLTTSTIALSTLTTSPCTVYFILPPDRMATYRRWLRLMLACTLLAVTRTQRRSERHVSRVVFLLDEFAHLGRMEPIEQQMALVAGYGATFWLFVQDFAQLKALYGERWQSFVANADVLQAFGTADQDTAEYLSKLTGDATIQIASDNLSRSISHGKSGGRQISAAQNIAERSRRLLLPDEVRRLGSKQLLFVRGCSPVLADRLSYIAEPNLWRLAERNPYVNVPG